MNTQSPQQKFNRRFASLVTGLLLSLAAGCVGVPTTPVWNMTDLDACQKSIESEGFKLEKKIFGALKKCNDMYRAASVAGDPLADAVAKCDVALGKVLTFPDPAGKSAMAKAKAKLDSLLPPGEKCGDGQLVALGYPPTNFGDKSSRLVLVQSLKQAVDHMSALVGDTIDNFVRMQAAGCLNCAQIASSPCVRSTCRLVSPSNLYLEGVMSTHALDADLALDACSNPNIMGTDVAVFASSKQSFQQTIFSMAGGTGACIRLGATRGFIAGATSPFKADVASCVDHVFGDGDECPAFLGASSVCSSPQSDPHHGGVTNSGHCLKLTVNPGAAGDSFLFAAIDSHLVCTPGTCAPDTRGPDALACTDDDLAGVARYNLPLTTASATASILDATTVNGNTVTSAPVAGAPVSIDAVDKRFSGTWVAALPGLHVLENSPDPPQDGLASVVLECD